MSSIRFGSIMIAVALAASLVAAAPRAQAEPSIPAFGRAGTVVIDDLIGLRTGAPGYLAQLGYGSTIGAAVAGASGPGYAGLVGYGHYATSTTDSSSPQVETNAVWIAPAADVFIAPRLSLGLALGLSYMRQASAPPQPNQPAFLGTNASGLTLSAVPRVGYAWSLAPRFAIWPRLGVGYAHSRYSQSYTGVGPSIASSDTWLAGLDVKLVYQVTRHVYLDVAPSLAARVITTVTDTSVSQNIVVGMGGTVGMGVAL